MLQTPDGMDVPLMDLVEVQEGQAFTTINRRDGHRVVAVSMDARPSNAVPRVLESLRQDVRPDLRAEFPGITWSFGGSQAEMRELTQVLWRVRAGDAGDLCPAGRSGLSTLNDWASSAISKFNSRHVILSEVERSL